MRNFLLCCRKCPSDDFKETYCTPFIVKKKIMCAFKMWDTVKCYVLGIQILNY